MADPRPAEVDRFEAYLTTVRSAETVTIYARRAVPLLYEFMKYKGYSLEFAHRLFLQDFVAWMVQVKKYHPHTIRPMIAGVWKFIEFRRDEGITIPEIKRPDMPRIPKTGTPPLLKDEAMLRAYLHGLVRAEIDEPILTLLRVMPFCGLRISEMVRLRLDDVLVTRRPPGFPEWRMIRVRSGKGLKSREAGLLPGGLVALRHYAPELIEPGTEKRGWRSFKEGPWLWPGKAGPHSTHYHHVHRITVEAAVRKVRPFVGTIITPRSLRRTYATMLAQAGVPMKTAQEFLGHANIVTTAKHYTFLEREDHLRNLDRGFSDDE